MSELPNLDEFNGIDSLYDCGKLKKFVTIIDGEEVVVNGNGHPIDKISEMSAVEYFREIENSVFD